MTSTMRAARVHRFGDRPVLEDVAVPVPGDRDVLVRIEAAVVAHLDVTVAGGNFGVLPDLPYTPGVEGAGVVVSGGTHPPGTRVAVLGGVGVKRDGCWAELVTVPDAALLAIPDSMPMEVAAGFFVPLTTAFMALHDVGGFTPPEAVLVTGASGAIGAAVVQLALDAGAAQVVAVVGRASHRDAVLQDERVRVLVEPGDGLADALTAASITPPQLAVDTVGGDGLMGALTTLPPGSRVAALGYTRGTAVTLDLPNFLLADVELRPVNGIRRSARGRELVPHLAAMLASGRLTLGRERFAFDDLDGALTRLQSGDAVGRVVITPERP